jgi:hypothetical protein
MGYALFISVRMDDLCREGARIILPLQVLTTSCSFGCFIFSQRIEGHLLIKNTAAQLAVSFSTFNFQLNSAVQLAVN